MSETTQAVKVATDPAKGAAPVPKPERSPAIIAHDLGRRYIMDTPLPSGGKDKRAKPGSRDFWALRNISFTLYRGERLGVIGQNGSGKSTLLKILSRVLNPTEGEAFVYGRATSLLEVGTGFNPNLTGRQNIAINAALHGLTPKEIDARMPAIIDFSEIGRFIDEPVRTYSTGMRSRLGFAVAAHLEPDILMLDEVLSVGDAAFQAKCLNRMDDLTGHQRTLIFVSHSIGAIKRFCDRAIWLNHGELVMDGDVLSVSEAYEAQMMNITSTYQASGGPPKKAPKPVSDADKARKNVLEAVEDGEVTTLVAARVIDANGQNARSVKIDTPCRIEIEFDVFKPDLRIEPALHFKNERNEMLFVVAYTDPAHPMAINAVGRHKLTMDIPPNLLNEGLHYVDISMVTADPLVRHQRVEKAISFSVYEVIGDTTKVARGRYARGFPGGLRPRMNWKTETIND
jgi:lipopolysaccharide transport system ATP-binding protein